MGFLDPVKDVYYKAEEKYYEALDHIDGFIPIYKVIDPIDSVVPSFALLLVLIAALIIFAGLALIPSFIPLATSTLEVHVLDSEDNPLSGATVSFYVLGELAKSATTGTDGIANLENLELDTEVVVEVSKSGFAGGDRQTVTVIQKPLQVLEVKLAEESAAFVSKTIRLVDSTNASVSGNFSLHFRCSSPYATAPADVSISSGDGGIARNVRVPTNCETLLVSVSDDTDFDSVDSFEVQPDETDVQINLQETVHQKGTINVVLKSGGTAVDESIKVNLFRYDELLDNPQVGPVDFDYTVGGRAQFNVSAGEFVVKTVATRAYGAVTSPRISVQAGEEEEVTLELVAGIAGEIKVQVVDSDSGEPIDDAAVTLKLQSDDSVVDSQQTNLDDESIVSFNISRDVGYRVVVQADGYQLGKREGLVISDSVYIVELEACTPATCGSLRVKVLDQDGDPVENATVSLYNASTNFLSGYSNKVSDANGEAEFAATSSGNYFAFAFKESVSGRSDSAFFSASALPSDNAFLTVTMIIPKGIVRAVIKDKDGRPVPFPVVSVYNERTQEILGSSFADANGVFVFETKADKRIYFNVKKKDSNPRFADYTTISVPVVGQTVQTFNVMLEPEITDRGIELEFLGLFLGDKTATTLSKGEEYIAKFKLRVPEEKDYAEAGVHLRTGGNLIMEKDPLFIKEVNAPATSQIRATKFDEKSGISENDYDFTNSDAKWVNLVWNNPNAGVYEIQAVVKVKETASIKDELKVFWRAWAENGARERNPQDNTITQELYSEAFSRIFEVGTTTLCDEDFCFSARIRDNEMALTDSVIDSYNARMRSEYELKFTILNNSDFRIHDKANLRIKNEDETLLFTDYKVVDAQSREVSGVLGGSEFARFDVGKLEQKNKVDFTATFKTQKAQTGIINIRLVSDEQIIFEKNISIVVNATKKFRLEIQPSRFPSGIETDLNVLVLDAQTNLEVEGATVKLVDKHDNVLEATVSRRDGFAFLTMPAEVPGTKLFVEVQKPEYENAKVEISVEGELIEISPDQLGIALNAKTKQSAQEKFNITNKTLFSLKIASMKFRGDFKNLVDRDATQAALDVSYKDFVIEQSKTKEFNLKVALTEEGKSIDQRADIDAFLDIEVSNFGKKWAYTLPVKIAIDLEGEVDDPACLQVSSTNWQATTEGDPVKMELTIENNCVIGSKPIELKKLQGRIEWESNQLGIFDIAIGPSKTELRSGYNKTLLARLEPEQSVSAIITFTPFGGVNGIATGKIKISASNPQEQSEQVLENTIDAKIQVVNLVQCMSIDPVLVEMKGEKEGKETTTFNINVGTANVSCGGPVDYELESELDVTPKEGRVQDGATQAITVLRGDAIQGQYPVFVRAKFASQQQPQLIGTVRVRITEEGCIQLSRYEFDVYDNEDIEFDGVDTATVSNKCFDKPVPIRVNLRSFSDAMKFGSTIGLIVFGVSALGQGLGGMFGGGNQTGPGTPGGIDFLTEQQLIARHGVGGLTKVEGTNDIYKVNSGVSPFYYKKDGSLIGQDKYYPMPGYVPLSAQTQIPSGGGSVRTASPTATTSPMNELLFGTSTPTGLQIFGGNQAGFGGGGGGFGSSGGSPLGGGIFGMGSGLIDGILGKGNPMEQGLKGFLVATMFDYFNQEEDARFVTVQRDVEVQGVEIKNPGEDLVRSNKFNSFLSSQVVTNFIAKKVPDKFKDFLPYLSTGGNSINIFAKGDDDIEVEQELRSTTKALPETGMSPQLLSSLFGGRDDSTLPALALSANPQATNQKIEKRGLIFRNKSGFTTKEDEPLYKILRVMASRHYYKDKAYDRDACEVENDRGWFDFDFKDPIVDPSTCKIEELPSEPVDELFHLEFNAVPPETAGTEFNKILNCQDGTRVGSTGPQALPKVKFDWSWGAISEKDCDTDNEEGVFCDATQFGIATLKKIKIVSDWLKQNGKNLKCPSPLDAYANTSIIQDYDVGISKAEVSKSGNDAVVRVTVENKNPGEVKTSVKVELKNASDMQIVPGFDCSDNITVLSEETVECEYNDLKEGNYIVLATILPEVKCENCQNKTQSDFMNINFTIGTTGLEQCDPYSTARLPEFVSASDRSASGGAGEILGKVKFRANLIEDRYSSDFQKDFDLFSKTKSFFDAPDYYTDTKTGLGLLFNDPQLFDFRANFSETNPEGYRLPGPGIYNVVIDIQYQDNSWALFDEQGANAKVSVLLEKADTPNPPSPFYRMPFDGTVGDNGRVNYGLNYRGDSIMINNNPDALVKTIDISGSSPVMDLSAKMVDDFKSINTNDRGILMKAVGGALPQLVFAPGFATPVILKMSNKSEQAYAFYSVEVDGGAQNTGPFLTHWNGIGLNCKAFDDTPMLEYFFTSDTHGLNEFRDCALVPGQVEQTSYGFEFCNPKKFGNVYLKTVFYTPQGKQSVLKMNVAQEQAAFITPGTEGTTVALNNTVLGGEIHSVEDVFDLVRAEYVCVSEEESRTEFWWNPKKIFESLDEKESKLINSCISG